MRDSIIFYRSFYEAISELEPDVQAKVYTAIFEYSLNFNEVELSGLPKTIFTLIKPQLDANRATKDIPECKRFHWNWKGGVSDENSLIRTSSSMKTWRRRVFERDKYKCQQCGQVGGSLQAHHKKPFAEFPDLRTEVSNGLTLCKKCHINEHKKMRKYGTK